MNINKCECFISPFFPHKRGKKLFLILLCQKTPCFCNKCHFKAKTSLSTECLTDAFIAYRQEMS